MSLLITQRNILRPKLRKIRVEFFQELSKETIRETIRKQEVVEHG